MVAKLPATGKANGRRQCVAPAIVSPAPGFGGVRRRDGTYFAPDLAHNPRRSCFASASILASFVW